MSYAKRHRIEALVLVGLASLGSWFGYMQSTPRVHEAGVPLSALLEHVGTVPNVIVFDDFQCPACARFDRRVGERLRSLAGEGRIRLTYFHTPLFEHSRSAFPAAVVACARSPEEATRFRQRLHDDRRWITAEDPAKSAVEIAGNAADRNLLLDCMAGHDTQAALQSEAEFGRRAGIHAVPTVWLNNRQLRFRSYGSLLRHIEGQL